MFDKLGLRGLALKIEIFELRKENVILQDEVISRRIRDCLREALSHNFLDTEVGNLRFKESREWDSISHIRLMACLRNEFDIKLTFEEMIVMTSYEEILRVISRRQMGGIP